MSRRVGVIGAGAWGTALAQVAARSGHDVILWARQRAVADAINATRQNRSRLENVPLEAAISATSDAADLAGCDLILIATPAQAMREVLAGFGGHLRSGMPAVIAAKGIERSSSRFLVDVLADVSPSLEPLVLSGPSFASEVAQALPTAVTLAARSLDIARPVAKSMSLPTFRPYITDDLVGVQVGGAMKNVLAIAAGIVTGRGLGGPIWPRTRRPPRDAGGIVRPRRSGPDLLQQNVAELHGRGGDWRGGYRGCRTGCSARDQRGRVHGRGGREHCDGKGDRSTDLARRFWHPARANFSRCGD